MICGCYTTCVCTSQWLHYLCLHLLVATLLVVVPSCPALQQGRGRHYGPLALTHCVKIDCIGGQGGGSLVFWAWIRRTCTTTKIPRRGLCLGCWDSNGAQSDSQYRAMVGRVTASTGQWWAE